MGSTSALRSTILALVWILAFGLGPVLADPARDFAARDFSARDFSARDVAARDFAAPELAEPDFASLTAARAEETIAMRRWLHENPELSLREFRTREFLLRQLQATPGVEILEGDWGTGLVAVLRGAHPGPLLAYRADIDALPLEEATGLPFASVARDSIDGRLVGVMHACGHDLHAAMLIGTARVLSDVRDRMAGSVLLILEPAEEIGAGARPMIEAGALQIAGIPEAIFAIHDHPTLQYGQVGFCPERATANVDEFRVRVLGRGGHGAYPHRAIDPVVLAASIVLALQSIVSREIDALDQAVITVGSIQGGSVSNVIPSEVLLRGTVRTLEPAVREQAQAAILRTVKGIALAAGAPEPEIRYSFGTPSMYNDPVVVESTLPILKRVVGASNVIRYAPGMGGEDFAEFQKVIPGFMFRLGVGRPDREMSLHNPHFDPDERAIPLGVRLMCEILWERMHRADAY